VATDEWPATPAAVDAQRTTPGCIDKLCLTRNRWSASRPEFNRYAPKPIEIATPALRNLEISGVFATDDTEAFMPSCAASRCAVEVTTTRIRVSRDPASPRPTTPSWCLALCSGQGTRTCPTGSIWGVARVTVQRTSRQWCPGVSCALDLRSRRAP